MVSTSCSNTIFTKSTQKSKHFPVKQRMFVENPFGFEPNYENFIEHFVPPLKIQRFTVNNQHKPEQKDTIIKFGKGKTELFIYKTKQKRELFFAGNVTHKKIVFVNGVAVGMQRGAFFNCFTDLKYTDSDTVSLRSTGQGSVYKFVFDGDKLSAVKIQYNID